MRNDDGSLAISKYGSGDVTPKVLAASIKKLQIAFPSMGADFFNLLTERIIANGFTDERLQDAIAKVIDTFSYKELHVSDVIKFDKHIRLLTYAEICGLVTERGHTFDDYETRVVNGRNFWVRISDI